jgi:hypothetical protein
VADTKAGGAVMIIVLVGEVCCATDPSDETRTAALEKAACPADSALETTDCKLATLAADARTDGKAES